MTNKSKIIISFAALCAIGIYVSSSVSVKNPQNTYPAGDDMQFKAPLTESEPDSSLVSVPNSPTEKYILKYNEKANAVYLITKKTDGTEIISPVESIKPFYLTDDDIKALTEGIELTEKEDMFVLIEDFSS